VVLAAGGPGRAVGGGRGGGVAQQLRRAGRCRALAPAVRARPGSLSGLPFSISNMFWMVTLLYGHAGLLTAQNGGFRPGQVSRGAAARGAQRGDGGRVEAAACSMIR
jgi:hypothetical protein